MKILLTGASGFVGSHILSDLQQQGHNIIAIYRTLPQKYDLLKIQDMVTAHSVNMSPNTDWSQLLKGVDAIIHTGDGLRRFENFKTDPSPTLKKCALETTMTLAKQAQKAGVKSFVYLSSIKAATSYGADHIITENHPLAPDRPIYGKLKTLLEIKLAKLEENNQNETTMKSICLRSPIVYGRGGIGNFSRLVALADSPWPLPLAHLTNKRSIISVTNLSDALITAAHNPNRCSGNYFIHDSTPLTMSEMMTLLRHSLGRKRRLFKIPTFLVKLAETLPITKPVVSRFSQGLEVSSQKFEIDFYWKAPLSTQDAFQDIFSSRK